VANLVSVLFTYFVFFSSVNVNIHNNNICGTVLTVQDFTRAVIHIPGNVLVLVSDGIVLLISVIDRPTLPTASSSEGITTKVSDRILS